MRIYRVTLNEVLSHDELVLAETEREAGELAAREWKSDPLREPITKDVGVMNVESWFGHVDALSPQQIRRLGEQLLAVADGYSGGPTE